VHDAMPADLRAQQDVVWGLGDVQRAE